MEELPISSRRSQLKRLSSEGSTPSLATMVLQSLSNYLLALVHIEIRPTTRPLDLMSRSLSFIHSNRPLRAQRGSATTPPNCGNELSNLLAPFHKICTPMHTSRNAESFKITFVPVGPILVASRSA